MNLNIVLFSFVILNVYNVLDAQQLDLTNDCKCSLPPINPRRSGLEVFYRVPWQVSLATKSDGNHRCGGIIINHNWIVTNAQCVAHIDNDEKLKFLKVRTNVYRLNYENRYSNSYSVQQIIMDKRFNKESAPKGEGDIAFLEIEGSIPFNNDVGPACFPNNKTDKPEGTLRAFGFGSSDKKYDIKNYYSRSFQLDDRGLKETQLDRDGGCERHFICATNKYSDNREKLVCGGDLGMPLSADENGKTKVFGFGAFSFMRHLRFGEASYCDSKHAFVRLTNYMKHFDQIVPNNYCT